MSEDKSKPKLPYAICPCQLGQSFPKSPCNHEGYGPDGRTLREWSELENESLVSASDASDQPVVHHASSGGQSKYRELVRGLGSDKAAEKHIAARLRELADIVEATGYPKVFGWTDEGNPSPTSSVTITLSFPWDG